MYALVHTWYTTKTCEHGDAVISTFRLLSIFTVAGLKYNCIKSTKHHTARPRLETKCLIYSFHAVFFIPCRQGEKTRHR